MKAIFDLTVEIDDSNVGSTFSMCEGAEVLNAKVFSNALVTAIKSCSNPEF